ncbi:MAG: phage tail sheath subtilisin-like domain-containing protein [Acidobacteriota bacterium]
MPEYLAPGVFVEEVSFRQKTIEGVSTSTAGFVGPARFGPILGEPELLTSFSDFERIYGGLDQLLYTGQEPSDNYLAHAVRAFFEEGGRRLYVSRVYDPPEGVDGIARWQAPGSPGGDFGFRARYPGEGGNFTVTCQFRLAENSLGAELIDPSDPAGDRRPVLRGVQNFDTVWVESGSPATSGVFWAERFFDDAAGRNTFRLRNDNPQTGVAPVGALELDEVSSVRVLTVGVIVTPNGRFEQEQAWEGLTFHPQHRDALGQVFGAPARSRAAELTVPLVFETNLVNGAAIAEAMLEQPNFLAGDPVEDAVDDVAAQEAARGFRVQLTGGSDGSRPLSGLYAGDEDADGNKNGLLAFEDLEDISIIAAPGTSAGMETDAAYRPHGRAITNLLISHCERMRYRVAVLDSADGQVLSQVRAQRSEIDTTRAALYYPWVRVVDPITEEEIQLPPSGFMAGIYARNDIQFGVHKSPANEVVRLATGFEVPVNRAQQEALNPEGVNCLRFFEGRGYRVWGARTATSDPEWKYLNVRRYFAFLERSIEKGTQWAVFENNGEVLWANLRQTVEDFLFNEWSSNHLLGSKPEEAYFVRCDRTTMTQNDLDNGRLICLIGVAPLRPAEFVIFRIGQKTADSQG